MVLLTRPLNARPARAVAQSWRAITRARALCSPCASAAPVERVRILEPEELAFAVGGILLLYRGLYPGRVCRSGRCWHRSVSAPRRGKSTTVSRSGDRAASSSSLSSAGAATASSTSWASLSSAHSVGSGRLLPTRRHSRGRRRQVLDVLRAPSASTVYCPHRREISFHGVLSSIHTRSPIRRVESLTGEDTMGLFRSWRGRRDEKSESISEWPVEHDISDMDVVMTYFCEDRLQQVPVVGVNNYQPQLKRLGGRVTDDGLTRPEHQVALLPEPSNAYDSNAVRVMVLPDKLVGYLSRDNAVRYRPAIDELAQRGFILGAVMMLIGGEDYEEWADGDDENSPKRGRRNIGGASTHSWPGRRAASVSRRVRRLAPNESNKRGRATAASSCTDHLRLPASANRVRILTPIPRSGSTKTIRGSVEKRPISSDKWQAADDRIGFEDR